jgi:hypothetical protein
MLARRLAPGHLTPATHPFEGYDFDESKPTSVLNFETRRLLMPTLRKFVLLATAGLLALAFCGAASAYTSFTAYISSANVWTYGSPNKLDVTGYASYRDYDCTPSYDCDRNVLVELELRRGYSSYGPVMARLYGETGQYGS